MDWFRGSRFEICLIKALVWHGLIAIIAAVVFWAVGRVTHALGVENMLFFTIGDLASAITFAVLTPISVILRCLIAELVEIILYAGRRR